MTNQQTHVEAHMALVTEFGNERARMALDASGKPATFTPDPSKVAAAFRAVEASARALAAVPAPSELQESVRWKQLVHMVERGVTPEILVDWINHPNRLDYVAKLRAEHG